MVKLERGGLIHRQVFGRHRYYSIANANVARILESLLRLAPMDTPKSSSETIDSRNLRYARTCYDHLAGKLGIALTDYLMSIEVIELDNRNFKITEFGWLWIRRSAKNRSFIMTDGGRLGFGRLGFDSPESV